MVVPVFAAVRAAVVAVEAVLFATAVVVEAVHLRRVQPLPAEVVRVDPRAGGQAGVEEPLVVPYPLKYIL